MTAQTFSNEELENIGDVVIGEVIERMEADGFINKEDAKWANDHYVCSIRTSNSVVSRVRKMLNMREKGGDEIQYNITVVSRRSPSNRERKEVTSELAL